MKNDLSAQIAKELVKKIDTFTPTVAAKRVGHILTVTDGVIKIDGLPNVSYLELLDLPHGIKAVAFNLEEDAVGAIVLGDYLGLHEGDEVKSTGELLSVPVGEGMLGRVVNPLGEEIDGGPALNLKKTYPMEKIAPGVIYRQAVSVPVQTGLKAIDALVPIGRGQRELIIGDRNTGKTAVAIDTIINQVKENMVCIYVAVGQKTSRVTQVINTLKAHKAMDNTIVVAATASDPTAFQYIAPYAGTAIGEYFMDKGQDVLVIYDDLSKHAWAYRQISLILRRPSGREAYPGDVFYLHSRLLERSCRLAEKYGGGSMTALPIIETLANDVSAYIPTNVISITDGQIYLESDLFYAGQRPAINVGLSVSRVGSTAQIKAMKQVSGKLRLDLVQYRELAAFAQFSTDVDEITKKQIDRGSRMTELLKQPQYQPLSAPKQVVSLWTGVQGHLDDIPLSGIREFETGFLEYIETHHSKLLTAISSEKVLSEVNEKILVKAVSDFKKNFLKE